MFESLQWHNNNNITHDLHARFTLVQAVSSDIVCKDRNSLREQCTRTALYSTVVIGRAAVCLHFG